MNKFKLPKQLFSTPNSFLYKLTLTVISALMFFCIQLILLYILGNYQGFQDKSQQIILTVLSYTSIFVSIITIPVIFELILLIFTEKSKIKHIIYLILMILTIIFCLLFSTTSSIIDYLSTGIKH